MAAIYGNYEPRYDQAMSTFDQLDVAERLEELAGRIYRRLAEHYPAETPARFLFLRLADEEDQHRMRVKMVRARYARHDKALSAVRLDAAAAGRSIEAAERLHDRLAEWAPSSLAEALQLAIGLEDEFASVHAEAMLRDCEPDVRELFEMLASQDRLHADLLKSAGSEAQSG